MINKLALLAAIASIFAFSAVSFAGETGGCAEVCHIIKPYDEGLKDETLLVHKHFNAGIGCVDCHERTEETRKTEEQLYKNGEYDDPMFTREYESDFCFSCHGSYKELAERTEHLTEEWGRNPHESHLNEPDCYICHKVHQKSTFVCSECHIADWRGRLPEGWEPK
ncbi:hypothetical protein Dacet_1576 [Denitrovibrio acetiphilus DSM 12809]|uniref:Tetrahaem cytochrome domain-containing protein n=1 Tax=Denitrovibrio acetiphilus (strain DSM 12809 / NBRC 114555 / N2460) TaxID=522772 RepID=D4H8J6_DENA2|nr:cytochrome c3 family protein [Denitrovibrio acetiphilus]ADD68345.1 hypothetical protein Dacet_1576 [Denitrovibrio acetiphilus DSM 12809]